MSNGQGSQGGGGPVIAAVDGSDHSLRALEWARLAALRHGTGLMVAHVLPEVSQLYAGRRSALHDPNEPEEYADPVGDRVRALLESGPELPADVRYEALEGSVPEALRAVSAEQEPLMLVMGSRGRGGFAALLLGSSSRAVATTASCPVVVVPHEGRAARDAEGASAGRVVLGLHAAETPEDVLAFAFAEAAARGTTVQVVSAYALPPGPMMVIDSPFAVIPPEALADGADGVPAEREMLRAQTERLAPLRARYPDVPVEQAAVPGDAAGRLVEASRSAALVVVGRHHPRRRSLLIGSVAHAVLQHAHGPVAVVPALHDDGAA
ncbi:nucleotide-binding universal stress UspA family protein [Streptomyces sp. 3211.6]|uniref:universal stress protein n=1 Tax=Streptomyces TaxID=1883 RepID=UPI000CBADC2F|nr:MULTISPECIES: universal stress protein [Streptomyces]RKT05824.1 nucleotide-binding universal stress UspA family protein [Streptomyces sp. 3211.6]RPF41760.1 nucleotide-binding universal stress UspA family protein [Streptomyces sp. Ag109_G2-6]